MKTFLFLSLASGLSAAPLVKLTVGNTNVQANAAFSAGMELRTASRSGSEVALENGTLRTGSSTTVRAGQGDAVTLDRGLALLSSKPKFFRPRLKLNTASHAMEVRGTAQVYHEPGKALRVVVLEGKLTLSLNSMNGERVTLRAGQMLVVDAVSPSLPEPLEIDLDRLIGSAQLVNSDRFDALPTQDLVMTSVREQTSDREQSSSDSVASIRDGGVASAFARVEEIVQNELADEIDDLDNDGEEDDFEDFDDEDDDLDDDEDPNGDDGNDDGGDDGDDGGADPGDGGDGGDDGE